MSRKRETTPRESSSTDLFGWLDALFTKARPDGTPPMYVMHRFLAADPDYADVARWLQLEVREPLLVFATWQALLPREPRAPRLSYVAPKKAPEEEALVSRMKEVLRESRSTVEGMIAMVQLAGREPDLYREFGVTPP